MYNFGKCIGLLVVVDAVGTAGFLMCNKYVFSGHGSLASAAAMGALMCCIFMALGIGFGILERSWSLNAGQSYMLLPKGRWGGFFLWALLGIVGDILFLCAITFHMSLAFGGILNRGVILIIVNVGAWRMFRQRLNNRQWFGVFFGFLAAIGTFTLVSLESGSGLPGAAIEWRGIPLWTFFTLAGAFCFGAKDLLTRRLLTEVPVGTSIFWANLLGLPMCILVLLVTHTWLPKQYCSYPEYFIVGVLLGCLFLVFAVPCRHTAKRRELNPALHSEVRAGIVLMLCFAFDIAYHGMNILGASSTGSIRIILAAVFLSSLVSLILLSVGSFPNADGESDLPS